MSHSRLHPRATNSRPALKKKSRENSLFVSLITAVFWFVLCAFVAMVGFYFLLEYSGNPVFKTFVVQSGSMEPSIMTGDIIVIMPQSLYKESDVVTFKGGEERVITHRITEFLDSGDSSSFITKGDANRETDTEIVLLERIIGKVVLVIPKLGYFVTFGKSFYGIISLIVIPTAIIIADELGNMIITVRKKK
jgi:signal peptidase I